MNTAGDSGERAPQGLFLTGTDTGCGKTEIACGLMAYLRRQGVAVAGMKPVASGADRVEGRLRNADALAIQAGHARPPAYDLVNPFLFEPPVAPHLAAEAGGVRIDFERIHRCGQSLQAGGELLVVEGVGGWRVPLGDDRTVADLARLFGFPVVLVVGLKLGCINHAALTAEAIRRDGAVLAGWVGNLVEPAMLNEAGNLATLKKVLKAPFLGRVPRLEPPRAEAVAAHLDLSPLGFPPPRGAARAGDQP